MRNLTDKINVSTNHFQPLGGYCTTSNLFISKTGKPDPFGILSETIFGPIEKGKCSCGYLKTKMDNGKLCPKCGVFCMFENSLRVSTFGKIRLIFPVIKFNKKKIIINKILGNKHKALLDPTVSDANVSTTRYISVKYDFSKVMVISSREELAPDFFIIPMKITGIYTLIFVLKYLAFILKIDWIREFFDQNYIVHDFAVLPPDIRPILMSAEQKNQVFRIKVNDFYISLLNSNKRNEIISVTIPEDEKHWTIELNRKIINGDDGTDVYDEIMLNYDFNTTIYQYYCNEIYNWCYHRISGKEGLIRDSVLGRTLEFSSRQVITVDPTIKPYEVGVSRPALFVLWMPYFINYLVFVKKVMTTQDILYRVSQKKYTYIREHDLEVHKLFLEFLEWFTTSKEAREVQVLQKLSERGLA